MKDFFDALPWRLAAAAALLVAIVGAIKGIDFWVALERTGIVFIAFWLLGALGRMFFTQSTSPSNTHPTPPAGLDNDGGDTQEGPQNRI